MCFIRYFWLLKKSKKFILREICKRKHCPSIGTLALLLFICYYLDQRQLICLRPKQIRKNNWDLLYKYIDDTVPKYRVILFSFRLFQIAILIFLSYLIADIFCNCTMYLGLSSQGSSKYSKRLKKGFLIIGEQKSLFLLWNFLLSLYINVSRCAWSNDQIFNNMIFIWQLLRDCVYGFGKIVFC